MKLRLTALAAITFFIITTVMSTSSSTAQLVQQGRELKQKIPNHLPIKIKVKNLQNENWARDLEIEVTNTSIKPIYFLELVLELPEVKASDGVEIGFPLRYGRMALVDFKEPLQLSDVPIKPGEKYVFKIPAQQLEGWEAFTYRRNLLRSEPRKIGMFFGQINFGDGTGFVGTSGTAIPNKQSSQASWEDERGSSQMGIVAFVTLP